MFAAFFAASTASAQGEGSAPAAPEAGHRVEATPDVAASPGSNAPTPASVPAASGSSAGSGTLLPANPGASAAPAPAPGTAPPPSAAPSSTGSPGSSAPPGGVSTPVSPPIAEWSVPEGCPAAGSVDERARSLAGVDAAAWASAGSVRGRIVSEAGGWALSLQIERAPGSGQALAPAANAGLSGVSPAPPARVFHAGNCAELGEAAAAAIALALGGAAASPSNSGAAAENLPAPRAADAAQDAAGGPLASELRSIGAVARAEALLDTGSLGGLALGAGVELGVRWRALGLRAYGLGLPSRQVRLAPSQFVDLSLWAAGLRGCYRVAAELPLIDVCGGAEVGAFGAAGRGLVDARERRDAWGATTWGTWFGIDLAEHLQAGARFEAVVPLSRERYFVNRTELVHEMSAPSLRLALSLGGTLGSD